MLTVKDLHKSYQVGKTTYEVLKGVSLSVETGEFVAVMGPSGSGKTTLLNCISCYIPIDSGEIMLGDRQLANLSEDALAKVRNRQLGFVFQDFLLLDGLTVRENILLPAIIGGAVTGQTEARADQLCDVFGISAIRDKYPAEISGGEKQRTAVARALINHPLLILADEPTGNLDTKTTIEVMAMMVRMCRQNNQTLILVTHDSYLAQYADRIVTLIDGKIVSDVENKSIVDRMSNEEIVEYFLSENANLAETTVLESEEEIEAIRQELQEEKQAEGGEPPVGTAASTAGEEPAPKAELPEQESPADTAEENLEGNKQ